MFCVRVSSASADIDKQYKVQQQTLKVKSDSKFNFHRSSFNFVQLEGVQDIFDKIEGKISDLEPWNRCRRSRRQSTSGI